MRLSICTPTIDSSAAYIDEAIRSVSTAAGVEIEHIIVHDGSDDFSDALGARFPHLRILRGPGAGPTPAIALGLGAGSGDFVFLLNSDDRLVPGAIEALRRAAEARPNIEIWTGGTRIFCTAADGAEVTVRMVTSPEVTVAALANLMDDLPLLNARFIRRSVYERIGNMDPAFPASSDREFMIRAALAGVRESPLGALVSEMRVHEGSQTLHRRAHAIPPFIAEHIRLADRLRAESVLPPEVRAEMARWRAREVLRLAFFTWRAGRPRDALALIAEAVRVDPASPLKMMSAVSARQSRRRT